MAYQPKYTVKKGHLDTKEDVIVNQLQAVIFLHLVCRLSNREIKDCLCLDGKKLNLDEGTIGNHIQDMYDLIGIESKKGSAYRNRADLRQWACDTKLVTRVNGDWKLNENFLIKSMATA